MNVQEWNNAKIPNILFSIQPFCVPSKCHLVSVWQWIMTFGILLLRRENRHASIPIKPKYIIFYGYWYLSHETFAFVNNIATNMLSLISDFGSKSVPIFTHIWCNTFKYKIAHFICRWWSNSRLFLNRY